MAQQNRVKCRSIIIPKGTLNPNETTILQIETTIPNNTTPLIVARNSKNQNQNENLSAQPSNNQESGQPAQPSFRRCPAYGQPTLSGNEEYLANNYDTNGAENIQTPDSYQQNVDTNQDDVPDESNNAQLEGTGTVAPRPTLESSEIVENITPKRPCPLSLVSNARKECRDKAVPSNIGCPDNKTGSKDCPCNSNGSQNGVGPSRPGAPVKVSRPASFTTNVNKSGSKACPCNSNDFQDEIASGRADVNARISSPASLATNGTKSGFNSCPCNSNEFQNEIAPGRPASITKAAQPQSNRGVTNASGTRRPSNASVNIDQRYSTTAAPLISSANRVPCQAELQYRRPPATNALGIRMPSNASVDIDQRFRTIAATPIISSGPDSRVPCQAELKYRRSPNLNARAQQQPGLIANVSGPTALNGNKNKSIRKNGDQYASTLRPCKSVSFK